MAAAQGSPYDKNNPLLQKLPVDLYRLALSDWREFFHALGFDLETQTRIFKSLYLENRESPAILPGLSDSQRALLARSVTVRHPLSHIIKRSSDGSIRLSLTLHDGHIAETVVIPEYQDGILRKCSASISSQVGCFFGCSFCATGKMGFQRNLTTGELIAQVRTAENVSRELFDSDLTHLYFMGMGEPMHNYRAVSDALLIMRDEDAPGPAASHITVSTVGLFRQIRMLAYDHPKVRLAASIHSANQEKREHIMPVSARLSLPEIRSALDFHHRHTGSTPTIQYLMMQNINDHTDDAHALLSYLDGLPVRITLIMYNTIPGTGLERTGMDAMHAFKAALEKAGTPVDVRWCFGDDIDAGCGQLAVRACSERVSKSMRHTVET